MKEGEELSYDAYQTIDKKNTMPYGLFEEKKFKRKGE
jgi:hypothetical protein